MVQKKKRLFEITDKYTGKRLDIVKGYSRSDAVNKSPRRSTYPENITVYPVKLVKKKKDGWI